MSVKGSKSIGTARKTILRVGRIMLRAIRTIVTKLSLSARSAPRVRRLTLRSTKPKPSHWSPILRARAIVLLVKSQRAK